MKMTRQDGSSSVVAAVIANRSFEVGIAAIGLDVPVLHVNQISDNRLYEVSIAFLRRLQVDTVLFPASHYTSPLLPKLSNSGFAVQQVGRSTFSEDFGMETLCELSVETLDAREIEPWYLARASVAALRHSVESEQEARFVRQSLRIKIGDYLRGRMIMDAVTIRNLELLVNRRAVLSSLEGSRVKEKCVLDYFDKTVTKPGYRKIRSELAGPLCNLEEIMQRQKTISHLISNFSLRARLRDLLSKFHDLDSLTTHYSVTPRSYTMTTLRREADNTLRLRECLALLPSLEDILANFKTPLEEKIYKTVAKCREALAVPAERISNTLSEDGQFRRGAQEQRIEALFAVKPGLDGLLDVARSAYHNTISNMKQYIEEIEKCYPDLHVQLAYSARRGYHLRIPRKRARTLENGNRSGSNRNSRGVEDEIPAIFIRKATHKTKIECSTEELERMNSLQEQAAGEAFKRTKEMLSYLRDVLQEKMSPLYELTEAIATLDALQSYATFSSEDNFVQPTLFSASSHKSIAREPMQKAGKSNNRFELEQTRHLLMERAMGTSGRFVPNDIVFGEYPKRDDSEEACATENLAFVFGPNCGGKSTLLKSVAINCILAHLGCRIPAKVAQIPLLDRIMTRTGTEDNLEANASTFSLEMAETAHILRCSEQPESFQLVLIDELGRGTSTIDGLAIAWAVAEALQRRPRTFTLFATHFRQLEKLEGSKSFYFGAKVDQGHQTIVQTYNLRECESIDHQYNGTATRTTLMDGTEVGEVRDYGHLVAKACGFPKDALNEAKKISEKLAEAEVVSRTRRMRFAVLERDIGIMTVKQIRDSLVDIQAAGL